MLIFLQRILPDNDYIQGMSLKKFSKEVKNPDNKIRFKTKGHRCKVHKADIMDFIKSNLPKEISDEDIETYLKEVEQRKKEIFLAKIRENGP